MTPTDVDLYESSLGVLCNELEHALARSAQLKADKAALDEEQRLITKQADRARQHIASLMSESGVLSQVVRYGNQRWQVSLPQGETASLLIDDESEIPSRFFEPSVTLDRASVKKALEEGEDVPGASLLRKPASPRIKPLQ